MMTTENLPANCIFQFPEIKVRTNQSIWVENTDANVSIPFSIHSALYDGSHGDSKIRALLNHIRSRAKNKIQVLFTEGAHVQVMSLRYASVSHALKVCQQDAAILHQRFASEMAGLKIQFWEDFILNHKNYAQYKSEINQILMQDTVLQVLLENDAINTYTEKFAKIYPDKELFVAKNRLDILEMMTACKIVAEEGYKIMVYPGAMLPSMKHLIAIHYLQMHFINASITVK